VQCSAVQCSAVQCSAVQCSAVQCSAVQCSAVIFSTLFHLDKKSWIERLKIVPNVLQNREEDVKAEITFV
jgi:hypothetical protein